MAKQNISVTVDSVVFSERDGQDRILLIKRKNDPYKGEWAIPGGFLEDDEQPEAGALRELEEETGLKLQNLKQIRAFGKPDRDPRGRTISIAFFGEAGSEAEIKGNDDAAEAKWIAVTELPELAFDHSEIVKAAIELRNSEVR